MRRLRSFLRLSVRNQALFLVCLAALASVRVGLSLAGYRRLVRLVPGTGPTRAPDALLVRLAWLIPRAARLVPRATCLTQATAARLLLAICGHGSEIRVGGARDRDDAFVAHAWLVCGGHVVVGGSAAELARYTPFDRCGDPIGTHQPLR